MLGARRRAQLALEFLVTYSFILMIFILVFALIASQRAASMVQQQYAMLQLQTQSIANLINEAVNAGNGFNATAPLRSVFTTMPYNLTISTTGVVIAKEKVGSQVISAYSFSSARNLEINGTLVASGGGVDMYLIPTGSGNVRVANSKGTLYINQNPPSTLPLAGTLTLTQLQQTKAASFDGASSYVDVGNGASLSPTGAITIVAWVSPTATSVQRVVDKFGTGSASYVYHGWSTYTTSNSFTFQLNTSNDGEHNLASGLTLPSDAFSQIVGVYDGSYMRTYVNGVAGNTYAMTGTIVYTSTPDVNIGRSVNYGGYFSGAISNVQIYNVALTSNQIQQLYQNGIGGAPISANVVGWWPLDGNANDYSGNGNAGTAYNLAGYNSVVYANARVTLGSGASAVSALMGATGNGTFSASLLPNAAKYANSSGYASFMLTAANKSRLNFTLYGFNGNGTIAGHLVGWWPLMEGYGNTIYDLSTNYRNGVFAAPSWAPLSSSPNIKVPDFTSASSYISASGSTITGTDPFSIAGWMKAGTMSTYGIGFQTGASSSGESAYIGYVATAQHGTSDSLGGGLYGTNLGSGISDSNWHQVTLTYSGGTSGNLTLYVDGTSRVTTTATPNIQTSNMMFGKATSGTAYGFNGDMANVQLYNVALTPLQVKQLYAQGLPLYNRQNVTFG